MLRHFYRVSPDKLEAILSTIIDESINADIDFEQQVMTRREDGKNIIDGCITQQPFKIFIETKDGRASLDDSQINKYIEPIKKYFRIIDSIPREVSENLKMASGKNIFIIGLSRSNRPELQNKINKQFRKYKKGGNRFDVFYSVSFGFLYNEMEKQCEPHETELKAMLDDYRSCLVGAGVYSPPPEGLVAISGRYTMKRNVEHGICHNANFAKEEDFKFVGLIGAGWGNSKNTLINRSGVIGYVGEVDMLARFTERGDGLTEPKKGRFQVYDSSSEANRFWADYDKDNSRHKDAWGRVVGYEKDKDRYELWETYILMKPLSEEDKKSGQGVYFMKTSKEKGEGFRFRPVRNIMYRPLSIRSINSCESLAQLAKLLTDAGDIETLKQAQN